MTAAAAAAVASLSSLSVVFAFVVLIIIIVSSVRLGFNCVYRSLCFHTVNPSI